MKISLVSTDALPTPPARYGGTEAVVYHLARDLAALGHDVTLFARSDSPAGAGYRLVGFGERLGDVHGILRDPDLLRQVLDADVVHEHTGLGLGWELARRYPGRKFCATIHGPSIGPLTGWAAPPPNLVLCGVSHWHAWSLACELDCEVHGAPNGVPMEDYPVHDGPRDGYLLCLARLDQAKGIDRAIELARHMGMPLRIAGTATMVPHPDYVRAMLRRCDGRGVIYDGDLALAEKVRLLRGAECLLHLCGCWEEPFGLALVEANACGTPVVAFDRGSTREVLHPPYPGDWPGGGIIAMRPADLPNCVRRATATCTPWSCRRNAERFSVRAMTQRYIEIYQTGAGLPAPTATPAV